MPPRNGNSVITVREPQQHRQEGDQRHDRVDRLTPEALGGGGEPHGVFLHALRGALDLPELRPVAM